MSIPISVGTLREKSEFAEELGYRDHAYVLSDAADAMTTLLWWCEQLLDIIENYDITHDACQEEIALINDIRAAVDPAINLNQTTGQIIEGKIGDLRLEFEGDLDKWMKTLGTGITGYQPEAYALMDLACAELVRKRRMFEFLNSNPNVEIVWKEMDGDLSECCWQAFRRNGGRNDQEWSIIGFGDTVEEAVTHAMGGDCANLAAPETVSVMDVARPLSEYHEDQGPVVWWRFPVEEPSYIGCPNSSDWPGYHTHWTPHPPIPAEPTTN